MIACFSARQAFKGLARFKGILYNPALYDMIV
jgi:hypothetical protein